MELCTIDALHTLYVCTAPDPVKTVSVPERSLGGAKEALAITFCMKLKMDGEAGVRET